jgi:hypothetical protein
VSGRGLHHDRGFVGELAGHLRDAHSFEHQESIDAAKKVQSRTDPFGLDRNGIKTHVEPALTPAVTPPPIEETPMPENRPCGCGPKGRHQKTCALRKGGGADAGAEKPAKAAAKAPAKKTARRPAELAAARNGHTAALTDTDAKKTGEQLLGQLLRIRDNLDAKIESVRELIAIL